MNKFSLFIFILFFSLRSMNFSHLKPDSDKGLTKWPPYCYNDVYQGADFTFANNKEQLESYRAIALNADKKEADQRDWSTPDRETYGWIRALNWSEENLLTKPFVTWTVNDLHKINAEINHFYQDTPGEVRRYSATWPCKKFDLRAASIASKIDQNIVPTPEEAAYLKQFVHIFPHPQEIPARLAHVLAGAQQEITRSQSFPKIHNEINAAAWLHQQIVAIHPWMEANKRPGRLVMNIVLAQHGFNPPTFDNDKEYVDTLLATLINKDSRPFAQLVANKIEQAQKRKNILREAVNSNFRKIFDLVYNGCAVVPQKK